MTTQIIKVRTPSAEYDAVVGSGLLHTAHERVGQALGGLRRLHVVRDAGVPIEASRQLERSLDAAGFKVTTTTLSPSEDAKALQTVYHIVQKLGECKLERNDAVLALGGGIIGDMAGFAASMYRRGIRWVNCPTTLLAMADASVGGKTGVNLRLHTDAAGGHAELHKNMVGAFWQPALVLADVQLLHSLPDRVFRAGLAECIKHAMLSEGIEGLRTADLGTSLWAATKLALPDVVQRHEASVARLVALSVALKARVVEGDEREEQQILPPSRGAGSEAAKGAAKGDDSGGRALLNLGHTFGHAIETLEGCSPDTFAGQAPLQHGEAVALGLICAARVAELSHHAGLGLVDQVRGMLHSAGLPVVARGLASSGEIYERMTHDKKAVGGTLRLILPTTLGSAKVVTGIPRELILEAIDAIRG